MFAQVGILRLISRPILKIKEFDQERARVYEALDYSVNTLRTSARLLRHSRLDSELRDSAAENDNKEQHSLL